MLRDFLLQDESDENSGYYSFTWLKNERDPMGRHVKESTFFKFLRTSEITIN